MTPESLLALQRALEDYVLSGDKSIRRLFHGRGKCYPELEWLNVDGFEQYLLLICYDNPPSEFLAWLSAFLPWCTQRDHKVLLQRRHGRQTSLVGMGEAVVPERLWVKQAGVSYELRFHSQNYGLFLDMACARDWLRQRSSNRRVLNLFAYTCAFSVVAVSAGATVCVNVDMSSQALAWGRANHRANDLADGRVQYMALDILKSWGRLKRAGPFDVLIVDPPSFQKGSFVATRDYPKLIRRLAPLCHQGADILLCLNAPELSASFLTGLMAEYVDEFEFLSSLPVPEVFRDAEPERQLKLLHYRKY